MPDYKLRIIIEGEDRASGSIKNVGSALGSLGNIAGGVAIGNLLSDGIKGLAGMAKGALDSYAAYERLGQSINALTAKQALLSGQAGTMEQALGQTSKQSKDLLGWIQKLAIESPFRQEDVAGAFRLSMAMGFTTRESQRLTQSMLNFSTATGQGGETIERVTRALGQMRNKGKVSLEEVNQLTEAGIDVMRILSDATGLTGDELYKNISKGLVSADTAINAILDDSDRLYANAGKAAATGMEGLLSSLKEMQEITSRNFLTPVFQQLQGPLSALVTIVGAPEFQAGVTAWGAKLGNFTGTGLKDAADAMERINSAIQPLLAKDAPLWLTALQTVMAAGDQTLGITISPSVTSIKTPDGGLTVDVTAHAIDIMPAEGQKIKLTADWKEGTIGSAIAAFQADSNKEENKILVNAGWHDGALTGLQTLIDGTQLWAKVNPMFVMAETTTAVTLWTGNVATQLATGIGDKLSGFDWEAYKQQWSDTLDTWQPAMTGLSQVGTNLFNAIQGAFATPVGVSGEWESGTETKLYTDLQTYFVKPIMLVGDWLGSTLGSLWSSVQGFFNSKPVQIRTQGYYTPSTSYTPSTTPRGWGSFQAPIDVNQAYPEYQGDPRYYPVPGGATGFRNFKGGLALVGEEGPELVRLPAGADVFTHSDTKRMIPGFAGGTGTPIPPGWEILVNLLRPLGGWIDRPMGPITRADAGRGAWVDFTNQGVQAMQTAADRTGAAFEDTAKKVNQTFESALSSAPGLFGTSQVTADDMQKAQYGLYKPKADEWLRQLGDEVFNGVDRENVDIKDAAKRVGIDPNLPKELIYQVVKQAWDDSSLFANSQNLDLINTDAVKASLEQQQKELSGQASLKALFGVADDNLQAQSEALGQGLASVFGGASETDAVKGAGTALFAKTMAGFTDPGVAAAGVNSMAGSIVDATGTPENQAALYDAGKAGYAAYNRGWTAGANEAPIVPPGGGTGTTPPGGTPPAGNALGTPFWRGGWTVAGEYGPELLNLPGGTSIYDAPTTQRMRRGGMRPMVVNQTFVINDKLMAEQAAQRAVQLIRKGGR